MDYLQFGPDISGLHLSTKASSFPFVCDGDASLPDTLNDNIVWNT